MLLLTARDLQFRALRFVLVTVGVGVVMTLLYLMTGLVEQFNREPYDTVAAVGAEWWVVPDGVSGPFTASATLAAEDAEAVTGPDAVPVIVARGSLNAADREPAEVLVIGHVPEGLGTPPTARGRPAAGPGEIVVDDSAGFVPGDRVALGSTPMTVVGTSRDTTVLAGLPVVFLGIDEARRALFDGGDVVSAVLLSGPPDEIPSSARTLSAEAVAADALGPLENAVASVDLIRALLWIVTGIIIGAVVYLSALERQRDFAVLKAVGAANRHLVMSVGLQAVIIAGVGVGLAAGLQALIEPIFPLRVRVPAGAFWQIPLLAVLIAVIAALGGMRRVARSDPTAAFSGAGG